MKPFQYDKLFPYERREVREAYEYEQRHECYYCGNHLDDTPTDGVMEKEIDEERFPENFFQSPIHLHHNRDTGLTVGAVHAYCNAVLWQHEGE